MKTTNKNAPMLGGWFIGLAMGVVAFAVAKFVGDISTPGSVAIGIIVALLAGLVMGMPWGAKDSNPEKTVAPKPVPVPAPAPMAAPASAPAPKPAPVIAAPVPKAAPAPAAVKTAPAPVVAAPAPAAAMSAPEAARRPEALKAARGGKADDLKIIKGIGPKLEILCHSMGFYHFDQLANWTADEIAWVDQNLEGFKGRVTRDRWVPQAKAIVKLGPAEFLKRLDAGEEF